MDRIEKPSGLLDCDKERVEVKVPLGPLKLRTGATVCNLLPNLGIARLKGRNADIARVVIGDGFWKERI